ncbi:MAG: molybdopterin-binding protein [SAR324 cluster bacterium]|nr:molybdopterin-binding protein [SAR324 cluster bacterium]MCZ6532224.1 molybdopterin-binding protein [SAR324 cluster bacterium]MCZ6558206.1 molybdopterin-binding protein [SAR324 cluster bacterium]MCZ6629368.1 molybdopterin-binding protein [SAR324 cluster bacterium]MCZ6645447.1 molybdopterin-binding protein [SAR324 cluster bacterium]
MAGKAAQHPQAGMVVIGNEILTGKVTDTNSPFLCKELNFLGLELARITTIGDDFATIGRVVREFSEAYTWVFTSGGIGPTHDDITVKAVAGGFGVEAVRHPKLEEALRAHYQERLTEDHLLMALVPEGAELVEIPGWSFHQVLFRNIFILPGVPQLFQHRFHAFKHRFQGQPLLLKELFLKADEGTIAAALRDAAERFPGVMIGSYPDFSNKEYSVKVTVEAREQDLLGAAVSELQEKLAALPITIVRVE